MEALRYAHETARVVHRDLKPANLLLTRGGRIKLTDFGIASSLSDTMTRLAAQYSASGTPPYSSPQQLLGESPTPLDDIYSLGATFYDLLTGKAPFFRGDILAQVRHMTPPPMAERRTELEHAGESIPAVWERTIAACLAKDPVERPQSVRDLAERPNLDDAAEAAEVRLTGDPQRQPHAKWKRPLQILAAVLAVSLILGIGFESIRWRGASLPEGVVMLTPATPVRTITPSPSTPDFTAPVFSEPPGTLITTPSAVVPPRPTPAPQKAAPAEPTNKFEEALAQGKQLRERGDINSALVKFREAAAMDPKNPIAIAELATTYEKMGAADRGAEQWRKIYDMGDAAGVYYSLRKRAHGW